MSAVYVPSWQRREDANGSPQHLLNSAIPAEMQALILQRRDDLTKLDEPLTLQEAVDFMNSRTTLLCIINGVLYNFSCRYDTIYGWSVTGRITVTNDAIIPHVVVNEALNPGRIAQIVYSIPLRSGEQRPGGKYLDIRSVFILYKARTGKNGLATARQRTLEYLSGVEATLGVISLELYLAACAANMELPGLSGARASILTRVEITQELLRELG